MKFSFCKCSHSLRTWLISRYPEYFKDEGILEKMVTVPSTEPRLSLMLKLRMVRRDIGMGGAGSRLV